jgi:Stress responsive A/B Barrel Domain
MIRHTVVFRLKHSKGSAEERAFLADADVLKTIPGVEKFEKLRQVSAKNGYAYGFSMEFADEAAYQGYNDHPEHVRFVKQRWVPEVEEFLEIDYERL